MIKYIWGETIPGFTPEYKQEKPSLDLFTLADKEQPAAIIVFPGGGYAHKAEHEGAPVARWLNDLGIAAFVLDYRVAPYRHPYPMLDAQRAIRHVRLYAKDYNVDPNRIGVLGFSAGGHLASTVSTHFNGGDPQAADLVEQVSSRPNCAILCYPVISLIEYHHKGSMLNLLGEDPPLDLRQELSNEKQVTRDNPPTFLWHTADDSGVPVENSMLFAQSLSRHNVEFALHIFRQGKHGLGLAENHLEVGVWTKLCAQWLEDIGFRKEA